MAGASSGRRSTAITIGTDMRHGLRQRSGPWAVYAACILLFASIAAAQAPVPLLKGRVTDLTGTLSAGQAARIEQRLKSFEAKKGAQIAVLIVPTTQPETIDQYAVRVEEVWKLGRKGVDDSALLVIAKDDRTLRIEVGYGLEGALNDATAKRIISEAITPRFKQGDVYGGISAGVERMIAVVEGEKLPPPPAHREDGSGPDLQGLLVLGFILVFVIGGVLRSMFGQLVGSSLVGIAAGVVGWFMVGTLVIGIAAGIIAFIVSLAGAGRGFHGGGGLEGGGWSGGGQLDGGFSGGGGSSGGGGASGSW